MNPSIDRRTFLKRTAAASVLLGFPFLTRSVRADDAPDKLDVLQTALARMKEEHKPGIAILFPSDEHAQAALGHELEALLASDDAAVKQLFCEAVFVCVRPTDAEARFPQCKGLSTTLCLAPDGKVEDSLPVDGWRFRKSFVSEIGALIHGKDGERLRRWAEIQRQTIGNDAAKRIDDAVRQLGAVHPKDREAATKELAKQAANATAILALRRTQTDDPEVRHRIDVVFTSLYAAAANDKPGARLPFGVEWTEGSRGCGGRCGIAEAHVMVACGMARVSPASIRYLRFVTEARR